MLGRLVVVGGVIPGLEIRGDRLFRAPRAKRFRQPPDDVDRALAPEMPPIHEERGMVDGLADPRRRDLLEFVVFQAPEHIPPFPVQAPDRLILGSQPLLELRVADRAVAIGLVAELVVQMPPEHGRRFGKLRGQRGRQGQAGLPIARVIDAEAVPAAELQADALIRFHLDGRILLHQPRRRRAEGRAQQQPDIPLQRQAGKAVHPREVVASLRRLEPRPGELPHAQRRHERARHHVQIVFPARRIPMFGVIGGPKSHNRFFHAMLLSIG